MGRMVAAEAFSKRGAWRHSSLYRKRKDIEANLLALRVSTGAFAVVVIREEPVVPDRTHTTG